MGQSPLQLYLKMTPSDYTRSTLHPERSVAESKDAAHRLFTQMLYNQRGVTITHFPIRRPEWLKRSICGMFRFRCATA